MKSFQVVHNGKIPSKSDNIMFNNNNNNNNNNNRCTPLDVVRANAKELPTDEEYNNKVKRQWSQKALHGRHSYDLSQQYVDLEALNKWLTKVELFAETEGFLIAKHDQVILKRNYKKHILKQLDTDELSRRCGKESETI